MRTRIGNKNAGFTLVEIMIVVAIIGLLAAIAIPNFVKARQTAQRNACIRNLHEIDGAKEEWALETKKSAGSAVDLRRQMSSTCMPSSASASAARRGRASEG